MRTEEKGSHGKRQRNGARDSEKDIGIDYTEAHTDIENSEECELPVRELLK